MRLRSIFFSPSGASLLAQLKVLFSGFGSTIQEAADGILVLLNNAGTGFTRLCFGPATNANAALDHVGVLLRAVLADGSTYTNFQAASFFASAAAPVVAAGVVSIGSTTALTVGAAGAGAALPATPAGFLIINVAGTQMKLPYYNT